jgi:hypothetical protein
MQISRHWRMNSQRYRLEGVRYGNGHVSLQARPFSTAVQGGLDNNAQEMKPAVDQLDVFDQKKATAVA